MVELELGEQQVVITEGKITLAQSCFSVIGAKLWNILLPERKTLTEAAMF